MLLQNCHGANQSLIQTKFTLPVHSLSLHVLIKMLLQYLRKPLTSDFTVAQFHLSPSLHKPIYSIISTNSTLVMQVPWLLARSQCYSAEEVWHWQSEACAPAQTQCPPWGLAGCSTGSPREPQTEPSLESRSCRQPQAGHGTFPSFLGWSEHGPAERLCWGDE